MKIEEPPQDRVQAATGGDLAALDALLAGLQPGVFQLALRMLGHRETDPDRKIDPAGLDMNDARQRVAHLLTYQPPSEDQMTPEQAALLEATARKVDVLYEQLIGTKEDAGPEALRQLLRSTGADADATEKRTRPERG